MRHLKGLSAVDTKLMQELFLILVVILLLLVNVKRK